MEEFNNIKSVWEKQSSKNIASPETLIKKAEHLKKTIRNNHTWTQIILSLTMIVLIVFFISVTAFKYQQSLIGATLMVFSLAIRMLLEFRSKNIFLKLDSSKNSQVYVDLVTRFYQKRKKIHYFYTPIIFASYITGFLLLLPYFKKGLSEAFYLYVVISGFIIFTVLIVLVYKQIKEELKKLTYLKGIFKK